MMRVKKAVYAEVAELSTLRDEIANIEAAIEWRVSYLLGSPRAAPAALFGPLGCKVDLRQSHDEWLGRAGL
jgi:hypothetical protein